MRHKAARGNTVRVELGRESLRLDREHKVDRSLWSKMVERYAMFFADPMATPRRRETPIMAYVGPNGSGKTLAMIKDTMPSLEMGRPVLSNVPLYDFRTGELHACYVPFTSWDQLRDAKHCDVLMDEMTSIAHSREGASLPGEVATKLNQLRKDDVQLRWTAPAWARADKLIRECTQAITVARGSHADRSQNNGEASTALWARNRLFHFRTYATVDFDEWTSGKKEKLDPLVKEVFWGAGSDAFKSYDTLGAVSKFGATSDAGICVVCDGRRTRDECTCHDYQHRRASRKAQRAEAITV